MLGTLLTLAAAQGLVLLPARRSSRIATGHRRGSVPRLAAADDERRKRLEELERLAAELSDSGTDVSAITGTIAELRSMLGGASPEEVPPPPPLEDGDVPPPPPLDGDVPPPPQWPPASDGAADIFSRRPVRGEWSADEDVAADAGDVLEERTRRILSDAAARRESEAAAAAAAAASAPPPPPAAPAKPRGVKTWKGEDLDAALAARAARDAAAAAEREEAEAALLAKKERLAEMERLAAELSAGGADTSAIAGTIAALRASLQASEREAAALSAPPPPPPPPSFAPPPPTRTLTDDEINEELRRRLGVGESPRGVGSPSPPAASGGMGYMRRNESPAGAENLEQWFARVGEQMRSAAGGSGDDGRDRDGDGRTAAEIEEGRAAAAQRSARTLAEATSNAERFCLQQEVERAAAYGRAGEAQRATQLAELDQYYVAPLRTALSEASLFGVAPELLPPARQVLAELDAMVARMQQQAPPPEPEADGPFGFLKRR